MPLHCRDGHIYLVDVEDIWREHMLARRQERAARWALALVVALVIGLLAGLIL